MISRHFNIEKDLELLRVFLAEMRAIYSEGAFLHYADLNYRMFFKDNGFNYDKDIFIWEENNHIIGFVLYLAVDVNPEFMINPKYYDDIFDEVLKWTINRAKSDEVDVIETGSMKSDVVKSALLIDKGFELIDDPYVFMVCDNASRQDQVDLCLPKGYEYGTASEFPDLPGISEAMRKSDYEMMIQAPNYIDELGMRIIYNKSEVAAGCIAWIDEADNSAEFEPVGTVEAHRKKGLSYKAMSKVLESLRKRNIKKVYVRTNGSNIPAIKLYEKLGFVIEDIDIGYSMNINQL